MVICYCDGDDHDVAVWLRCVHDNALLQHVADDDKDVDAVIIIAIVIMIIATILSILIIGFDHFFSNNHSSGKWQCLKGNYFRRDPFIRHFHDDGGKMGEEYPPRK